MVATKLLNAIFSGLRRVKYLVWKEYQKMYQFKKKGETNENRLFPLDTLFTFYLNLWIPIFIIWHQRFFFLKSVLPTKYVFFGDTWHLKNSYRIFFESLLRLRSVHTTMYVHIFQYWINSITERTELIFRINHSKKNWRYFDKDVPSPSISVPFLTLEKQFDKIEQRSLHQTKVKSNITACRVSSHSRTR